MTVSSALAPFDLPHDGRCVCAECPWGQWCNYCIMKMEPRPNELILINRKRPSAPIFLSRDEAVTVAQGLAKHEHNEAWGEPLSEVMTFKPEPPKLVDAAKIKHRALLSEYLVRLQEATNNAVGLPREMLSMWAAPIMAWDVIGDPAAWPEPDTHDEWRKLNEGE